MSAPDASSAAAASAPASTLDLEAYVANYTGITRIRRLAFIASVSPLHKQSALQMAAAEAKRTTNTSVYLELINVSGEDGGLVRDDAWLEQVDRKVGQQLDKLEAELNQQKTSLVKENIRMGHNDLGAHHFARGDFNAALKCYVRTRDYCTTSKHVIEMCTNVIRASVQMGNFTHVANYITKAEATPEGNEPSLVALLRVASGLALLEAKKYKAAARKFLEVPPEHATAFSDVCSAQDVALYGGLCALASFERAELKARLVEASSFRAYLELYPAVREAIADFHHCRYAACLSALDALKPDVLLDVHLHAHVRQLYADVRSKALVQYFSPFLTVDMRQMAEAFHTSVDDLEEEIAALISGKQISARIDSQAKVLHARQADARAATFASALRVGDDYLREMRGLLLRIQLMKSDYIVRGDKGDGPGGFGPSKSSRQEARTPRFQGMDVAPPNEGVMAMESM